jgi:hypothetical protein
MKPKGFTTVFTKARHRPFSSTRWIQFKPPYSVSVLLPFPLFPSSPKRSVLMRKKILKKSKCKVLRTPPLPTQQCTSKTQSQ